MVLEKRIVRNNQLGERISEVRSILWALLSRDSPPQNMAKKTCELHSWSIQLYISVSVQIFQVWNPNRIHFHLLVNLRPEMTLRNVEHSFGKSGWCTMKSSISLLATRFQKPVLGRVIWWRVLLVSCSTRACWYHKKKNRISKLISIKLCISASDYLTRDDQIPNECTAVITESKNLEDFLRVAVDENVPHRLIIVSGHSVMARKPIWREGRKQLGIRVRTT